MKKLLKHVAYLLGSTFILIGSALAQESNIKHTITANNDTKYYDGQVEDLAWMHGQWQGSGLGGTCYEAWQKPAGGTMMGMFKLVKDAKIVFYEFLVITKNEGRIEMQLKHFTPDMIGWEEKDKFISFKLIKMENQKAYFEGLTIEKTSQGTLQIYLTLHDKSGKKWEESFTFSKNS